MAEVEAGPTAKSTWKRKTATLVPLAFLLSVERVLAIVEHPAHFVVREHLLRGGNIHELGLGIGLLLIGMVAPLKVVWMPLLRQRAICLNDIPLPCGPLNPENLVVVAFLRLLQQLLGPLKLVLDPLCERQKQGSDR